MAIARKGSRKITFNNQSYRWYIRRKPTYCQAVFQSPMLMAVESETEGENCVLLVNFNISRPDNAISPHQTAVTPNLVCQVIDGALAAGWKPEDKTPNFQFNYGLIRDCPYAD